MPLKDFVRISQYAGRRFDLTQANGGNSSVKIGDDILLKSSGFYLSDVTESSGFSRVILKPVQAIHTASPLALSHLAAVIKSNVKSGNLPSIEIGMHVLLGKFVLHTHPLAVNTVTCHKDWQEILTKLFPEALLIEYATPGNELAIQVLKTLRTKRVDVQNTIILFLQNHGLVVSANDADTVIKETERVVTMIEKQQHLDFSKYKIAAQICDLMKSVVNQYNFCHYCADQELNTLLRQNKSLFFKSYCIPIAYVYNTGALEIKNLEDTSQFRTYLQLYKRMPRVIIYQNQIYILAKNIQKAQELESVLKEHILLHYNSKHNTRVLTASELQILPDDAPLPQAVALPRSKM